jgi:hypothetical protein
MLMFAAGFAMVPPAAIAGGIVKLDVITPPFLIEGIPHDDDKFTGTVNTLLPPIVRILNRGDQSLWVSVVAGQVKCSEVKIPAGAMKMLPASGEELRWHDGSDYRELPIVPYRAYEISWSGTAWVVEDVTDSHQ